MNLENRNVINKINVNLHYITYIPTYNKNMTLILYLPKYSFKKVLFKYRMFTRRHGTCIISQH